MGWGNRRPTWDDREPADRPTRPTKPCKWCARPVIQRGKKVSLFCHEGCRRASEDAHLRLDKSTLKVEGDGCWEWQGTRNRQGYGLLSVGHRTKFAHRLALARELGRELTPGELALHKCNNPPCVRVGLGHLYVGDHDQNMRDMADANRGASSKTTWEDRLAMAEAVKVGQPVDYVAKFYGVSRATVRNWVEHFFPSGKPQPEGRPDDEPELIIDYDVAD